MNASTKSDSKTVSSSAGLGQDLSTPDKPKVKCTKKCRKCGEVGHVEKYCLTTEGGCLFIGDLPPSYTEEDVKTLVDDNGGPAVNVRSGLDKFGSRWALVNMETKEGGEAVIKALGHNPQLVVAEHNGVIAPRRLWPTTPVANGDTLEIVTIVGGGS